MSDKELREDLLKYNTLVLSAIDENLVNPEDLKNAYAFLHHSSLAHQPTSVSYASKKKIIRIEYIKTNDSCMEIDFQNGTIKVYMINGWGDEYEVDEKDLNDVVILANRFCDEKEFMILK